MSIFDGEARCARAGLAGKVGSTESRPTDGTDGCVHTLAGECRWEYMDKAARRAGSTPARPALRKETGRVLTKTRRQPPILGNECLGNYMTPKVAGSNPAVAAQAAA